MGIEADDEVAGPGNNKPLWRRALWRLVIGGPIYVNPIKVLTGLRLCEDGVCTETGPEVGSWENL